MTTLKPPLGVNFPDTYKSRAEVVFEAPINVQYPEYGAKGDGTTDDTAAFAAVDQALNGVTGGRIYVPGGIYMGRLSLNNRDNLTIFGDGSNTVVHNTTAGVDAVSLVDCDEATVRDIRVQGIAGTRHGLSVNNCQRAKVERIYCYGTGANGIQTQRCFGIVIDSCVAGPDTPGPRPAGVPAQQSGLVLTWDGVAADSGCNSATIIGGNYVVGRSQDFAVQLIRAENCQIIGPITELSGGGIYAEYCEQLAVVGYYGEANPSDVEYSTGTVAVTNGSTAVTGSGTAFSSLDGEGYANAYKGKYLTVTGTGYFARIASAGSGTALTLAEPWPGPTASGLAFRITGADLVLNATRDSTVMMGRGGGAVLLRNSSRNHLKLTTDSFVLDQDSSFNVVDITTNRAGSATNRVIDGGASGNIIRQVSRVSGIPVRTGNQRIVALQAQLPAAADNKGAIMFVDGNSSGSKFQGSDGSSWVPLG